MQEDKQENKEEAVFMFWKGEELFQNSEAN